MRLEKLGTLILIVIFTGAIVFMGARFAAKAVQDNWEMSSSDPRMLKKYELIIAEENDVNRLTEQGVKLAQGNQPEAAIINFKRTTELEPKYRDGWVWLGYAQLKNEEPDAALKSLQEAEKLDPTYPQTFELLRVAYERTGDTASSQKAQERYEFLTKQK